MISSAAAPVLDCIVSTVNSIRNASVFMLGYIPCFAAAVTASGQPLTGAAYNAFLFATCQMVAQVGVADPSAADEYLSGPVHRGRTFDGAEYRGAVRGREAHHYMEPRLPHHDFCRRALGADHGDRQRRFPCRARLKIRDQRLCSGSGQRPFRGHAGSAGLPQAHPRKRGRLRHRRGAVYLPARVPEGADLDGRDKSCGDVLGPAGREGGLRYSEELLQRAGNPDLVSAVLRAADDRGGHGRDGDRAGTG